jgi:hypothetical protein
MAVITLVLQAFSLYKDGYNFVSVQHHMSWFFFYIFYDLREDCLFCWYWWNCCPSLFKFSFHKFTYEKFPSLYRLNACRTSNHRRYKKKIMTYDVGQTQNCNRVKLCICIYDFHVQRDKMILVLMINSQKLM